MTRTLLIDNFDSFTYNIYQLLGEVNGEAPTVVTNDADWDALELSNFDNIVVSPGPGRPEREVDFGISARAITDSGLPTLGICLGHQGICYLYGGRVDLAPEPRHGRPSIINHDGLGLFAGIPNAFTAIRYHSLVASEVPPDIDVTAWTDDGIVMAVASRNQPLWGVQFHPESICTEYGFQLLSNFRDLSDRGPGKRRRATRKPAEPRSDLPRSEGNRSGTDLTVHCFKVDDPPPSEDVFKSLYSKQVHSFWLDSSSQSDGTGRFSFMGDGTGPLAEYVTADVSTKTVTVARGERVRVIESTIFDYMHGELEKRFVPPPPEIPTEFNLGYVGYFGYELKANAGGDEAYVAETPDAAFLFSDRMLMFDNLDRSCWILCLSGTIPDGGQSSAQESIEWAQEMRSRLSEIAGGSSKKGRTRRSALPEDLDKGWKSLPYSFRHSKEEYLECIRTCLEEIEQGETYEVCLTNMVHVRQEVDPLKTYRKLRAISPVPYGAFMNFPDVAILSASPERFMTISMSGDVESRPIKGTRPRGETPEIDEQLRKDLANNEKDLSENLMIVDLLRNDLNRVCEIGSVRVPSLFEVVTYPLVHQLVSTVQGKLRQGISGVKAVQSAFPGGSMTGAPKIRTMQILDRLEKGPRGVYSGAMGWVGLSGALDISIVIRTIVVKDGVSSFGIGGAIVALSDPEDEFTETLVKARAMLSALDAG